MRPRRRKPTRLPRPWDSPGQEHWSGLPFPSPIMKVKRESEVAESCRTLCDPMDCSLPGSSVHGISRQEYWSGVPLPSPHCSLDSSNPWYPYLAQGLCTSWLLILWGSAQSFFSKKPSLSIQCYHTLPLNFSTVYFFYSHYPHLRLSCVQSKSLQSCPTLCNPMDCSLPGSSVHGILQARILEWVAVPSSRGSSGPRDRTCISYTYLHWQVGSLPLAPPGKPEMIIFTAIYYLHWSSLVAQTVESACNAGDPGLIPGSGRSPGERNSNPLRFSCLENSMDGGARRATVHGVAKSRTRQSD